MRNLSDSSRKTRDAHLHAYVSSLPILAAEFRDLSAKQGIDTLEGIDSLLPANRLFLAKLPSIDVPPSSLPMWWNPDVGTREDSADLPFTRPQLRWIDTFQAHVALLVIQTLDGKWVSYNGGRGHFLNGDPVIAFSGRQTFNARSFVYVSALRKLSGKRPVDDASLRDHIVALACRSNLA